MRITAKSLTVLCNEVLDRTEMPFKVSSIERTRFTSNQYEGGACKQYIRLVSKEGHEYQGITAFCFYSKKELEHYLSNGYRLILVAPNSYHNSFSWEFDIQKT